MNALFSSQRTDWATPWELFRQWDATHGPFTLDVCATAENAKCERYFSPDDNGLAQAWKGVCWMNPPYGKPIGSWLIKALVELCKRNADRVVCLLPARTDTVWWHNLVMPYGISHFIRGRVRFEGAQHYAPFPSVIVIFDQHSTQQVASAGLAPQHSAAHDGHQGKSHVR